MYRAIWYHFCILKNLKNTHGGVVLLVKRALLLVRVLLRVLLLAKSLQLY